MDQFEVNTHSFIIKIWREEISVETSHAVWRGHITHVPGGERRYLKSLDDIPTFITAYIEEMGVKLTLRWRIKRWLKQRKLH
jgi:hypothetical protein